MSDAEEIEALRRQVETQAGVIATMYANHVVACASIERFSDILDDIHGMITGTQRGESDNATGDIIDRINEAVKDIEDLKRSDALAVIRVIKAAHAFHEFLHSNTAPFDAPNPTSDEWPVSIAVADDCKEQAVEVFTELKVALASPEIAPLLKVNGGT